MAGATASWFEVQPGSRFPRLSLARYSSTSGDIALVGGVVLSCGRCSATSAARLPCHPTAPADLAFAEQAHLRMLS